MTPRRIRLPVGGEQAGEGRHEVDAAVVANRLGESLDLGGGLDQTQVVPQPLDQGPRDGDGPFERIDRLGRPYAVAHGGQEPALGGDELGTGVQEHEVAGAVGVLGVSHPEAHLPESGRLLIAQITRDRNTTQPARRLPVHLRRGPDLGQERAGHAHDVEYLLVPFESAQIHQHGAAGIGDVGDVEAAVGSPGQVPQHPRVQVAEGQISGFGPFGRTFHVLKHPADLGSGEVGGEGKAHPGSKAVLSAVGGEFLTYTVGAGVLPDDGVVDRLTGAPIPEHNGLPLIGHPDRGEVGSVHVAPRQGALDDALGPQPDLLGIVLDPAGTRVDLLVLLLVGGHDPSAVVKDHAAGAGGSLIDGCYVSGHRVTLFEGGTWLTTSGLQRMLLALNEARDVGAVSDQDQDCCETCPDQGPAAKAGDGQSGNAENRHGH